MSPAVDLALKTAVFSTYPPRACGIGTFAADVRAALLAAPGIADVGAVVVDEQPGLHGPGLLPRLARSVRQDYVRAARLLSLLDIDVVLLQHEFGIFGGADGEYVLSFAEEFAQPLVVTLHTVLAEPSDHQEQVLAELCRQAALVIVMTETAKSFLVASDVCSAAKVRVVPHGAPPVLGRRAAEVEWARAAGAMAPAAVAGGSRHRRFVLSTFGLISPGKGLETAIAALPPVVERHPEVLYVIAGQTHPEVAHREGERYRQSLVEAVADLGLERHVEFDDRFLSIGEIADLLAETQVFVTPYRNREQIASGALTYGIAAGCGVVSTPYWYAEDMLASGAGEIVPFGDPAALGAAVCRYIEQPELLAAARAEARRIGEQLAWPSVAEATAAVLREAVELSGNMLRGVAQVAREGVAAMSRPLATRAPRSASMLVQ